MSAIKKLGYSLLALALSIGMYASARDSDTIPLTRTTSTSSTDTTPTGRGGSEALSQATQKQKKENETSKPYIASIDTYGSNRIDAAILKQTLGPELEAWTRMGVAGDPRSVSVENKLLKKIKETFGFAHADWTIAQYYTPGDLAVHITLDVVEPKDVSERMPFLPAPTGQFKDPDNLIAAWDKYEDIALSLVSSGQLEAGAEKCEAFHCPFGHKHPKLKSYQKVFVDGVKNNLAALEQIQSQARDPEMRASATYLLAYAKNGAKVVSLMVGRIKDPDDGVRNNALRVLGDIAEFHPDLVIPLQPVMEALKFPRTSDRTKAVYALYLTAMNSPDSRAMILKNCFPQLLAMMSSGQPDSRNIALGLMKKISGKDYAAADRNGWERWYSRLPRQQRLPSNNE